MPNTTAITARNDRTQLTGRPLTGKTDIKDAQWLRQLLEAGLLKPSK